ncbi:Hypothetical protein A7982_00890 [Minicystis rosea]|nr:Hypothetical protein A7982_00890 [Minicystis rosea]
MLLRVERLPTQEDVSHAWAVLGPDRKRAGSWPMVRGVRVDCEAAERGGPEAVRIQDVEVAPALADAWLNELHAIHVLIGGFEEVMGLDGTSYTLSVQKLFTSSSLSWWCEGPREWREVVAWTRRAIQTLHALTAPGEVLRDD